MPNKFAIRYAAVAGVCAVGLTLSGCARTAEARSRAHMATGKESLKKHNLKRAIIEFKVASQNTPTDPEPLYQLGLACTASQNGQCAMEAFEKVLKLNQNHEGALYQMARMQAAAGQPEILNSAAELLARVIHDHPGNAPALFARSMVEVKLGQSEQAFRTFDSALAVPNSKAEDIRLPIGAAINRGDMELARRMTEKAVSQQPGSEALALTSAEVAMRAGRADAAAAEARRALSINAHSAEALQIRLKLEIADKRFDNAESTARELANLPGSETRNSLADLLAARGKQAEALQEYASLRHRFPEDQAVQTHYAETLVHFGRRAEARTELNSLLEKQPRRTDLLLLRTRLSLDEGRTEDAGKDIAALNELKYKAPQFAFERARFHAARGERSAQGEALTQALQLNPQFLAARLQLARLMTELGKPQVAFEVLDEASESEKTNPQYESGRIVVLIALGDWKSARKAIDHTLQQSRTNDALVQDAAVRIHEADLNGAEKSLHEVLGRDPYQPAALAQMGALWKARKQPLAYLTWLAEFSAKNPSSAGLQLYAGQLLRDTGNLAVARQALERAALAGAQGQANVDLAVLEIRENKLDSAKARLLESLRSRDGAYQRAMLADILVRQSDWAGAEEHLRAAVRLAPGDSLSMMNLASVIAHSPKRIDEAVLYSEKAISISPGNPALEGSAGWLYYRARHYPDAVAHLEASLKGTDSPSTRYRLAAACAMAGDRESATAHYETALRQNPKDPDRQEASQLLGR